MALKIGIVLFRDATPFSREGNIACEHRGRPFYFSATTDLPSQTLWITNASSDALYEAGLNRSPHIASDSYFRTRLSQMVQELGLQSISLDQQVVVLAEILGCAAELMKKQLGLTQYPAYGMAQAVGQLYGSAEGPKNSLLLQVAEQSCQRFTACERNRRYEKAEVFSFWFPRVPWASEMLELPLPLGGLSQIAKHNLPDLGQNSNSLVDWAFESKIPLFARIRIHGIEERVGKLMNYGAGALGVSKVTEKGQSYDARNFREWCALPELAFLSTYGEVEVLQVVTAEQWQNTGLRPIRTKRSTISYAYGLAAENLWVGTLRKNSGNFSISKTLSTAWLQAEDRMRCLKTALSLHKAGMEITTYGNGRIGVVCPQSVRQLIPQAALESGLLYPASLEGLTPYPMNNLSALCVQQRLISSREYAKNIQVDLACLNEMEAAQNATKSPAI
jgi:hypothetical protein